jgi:O-antigen ligase
MTRGQVKKMIAAIGLACIATALLGTLNDDFKTGRMSIDAAGSDIQDPNDYAAHLILMIPALAYLTLRPKRPILWKLVGVASLAICFMQILSTGSRGGFVSLALTGLYIVFIGSKRVKTAVLVGVPLLALLIMPLVPKESLARLSTIFSNANGQETEATDSSQARLALLQASWKATLEHPLLGVGPGIFMDYQATSAQDNGQRAMWHVTHNAYTQVSSECGLPALIFYIGALGVTMLSLRKASKSSDREMALLAQFMSVMIVGFSVCIIFLSLAYNVHILVLSGLAVSLRLRLMADGTWTREAEDAQSLGAHTVVA